MIVPNISISEKEFKKLGLQKDKFTYAEFVEIVSKNQARRMLNKSVELAEKLGLAKMSMNLISKEVKAVGKSRQ